LVADSERRTLSDGGGWYGGEVRGGAGVAGGYGVLGGGSLLGGLLGSGLVGVGSGVGSSPAVGDGSAANAAAGPATAPSVRTVAVPSATKIGLLFDRDRTR
jgi:hypothetical protein